MQRPPVRSSRTSSVTVVGATVLLAAAIVAASPDVAAAAPGHQRWVQRYNGLSAGSDFGVDGTVSPDGSTVFVTGAFMASSENHDIATIAYNASDGTQQWLQRYGGPDEDWDIGSAVTVSPDGSTVFVTGTSWSFASDDDFITLAYDASDGTQLWVRRYTRSAATVDRGAGIHVSPDGQTVFVTGESYSPSSSAYVTIAYDAADGTKRWHKVTDGIAQADAFALSPDATRLFVTGGVAGATGNKDYLTVALDASTGAKLWGQRYNGGANGDDVGMAVGVGPSGSKVFVTGRSDGPTTLSNYATIAYGAADGSVRWVRRFPAPAHIYSHMALAVAPNGSRIVVTGLGTRAGRDEYATVAYGAAGAKAWDDRYGGPTDSYSFAYDVAITGDSRKVIVTGGSRTPATGYDIATIAYGATNGGRLWLRRYDGPDSLGDHASSVTISPDDSAAFVVGQSDSDIHLDDYLTIAYSLK
jgi:hypothetical protein